MNPAPHHPPTKEDLTCVPWDYIDAVIFFSALVNRVGETDFILSMHGSILRTTEHFQGNDLDLIATQWKEPGYLGHRSRFDRLFARFSSFPKLQVQHIDFISHHRVNVKFYYFKGEVCRIVDLLVVLL